MDNLVTIGKLSKMFGVSTRTIRHYEQVGLLTYASNTKANYRLYGTKEIRKLEKILLFKSLGFSLENIGVILSTAENEEVVNIFNNKLKELEKKELQILRCKDILTSATKIYKIRGLEYINNYNLLREMVSMNNMFAKTFNKLDLELQIKILMELYRTGTLSTETIKEIGTESGTRLLNELHMIAVKELLNKVDKNVEKNIIQSLEKLDPDFAEELKNAMFTFEDIVMLPDNAIEEWLKKCKDEELIIALSESGNYTRSRIFNNMLVKRAEKIKTGMENLQSTSLDQVYIAMTNLIEILKNMDCSGEGCIEEGEK